MQEKKRKGERGKEKEDRKEKKGRKTKREKERKPDDAGSVRVRYALTGSHSGFSANLCLRHLSKSVLPRSLHPGNLQGHVSPPACQAALPRLSVTHQIAPECPSTHVGIGPAPTLICKKDKQGQTTEQLN